MPDSQSIENNFLKKIREIIEENLSDSRFGVSELADKAGMSRSNLLRKVKNLSGLSVSQFIRQLRLKNAMNILKDEDITVSELSYRVGFSSTSYFVKCFHEHYGHPPGELGKRDFKNNIPDQLNTGSKYGLKQIVSALVLIIVLTVVYLVVFKPFSKSDDIIEKSIAVLPFKNDSNDSTNLYIINGLMESVLNNLQKIEDLRVISRTSVEKYRYSPLTIPEIADEINVNYFVEGSGQKVDDQIFLNIQLIESVTDNHIWAKQYKRQIGDIFQLQIDIAEDIAAEIEAIITAEEIEQIQKVPTQDLVAYDLFLKGYELLNSPTPDNLYSAIEYFSLAIERDNKYARAYAAVAIAYYLLDEGKTHKIHSNEINSYADKAMFFDSQLAQSLIAKALYYMTSEEYESAVSYFEKALELNPNSDLVLIFLVDLYANHYPNTEKYLEYALRGLGVEAGTYDSLTTSYSFLHISNAFIQSGFVDEAEKYINLSLKYSSDNLYSEYVKAYILFSKDRDLERLNNDLLSTLAKDSSRVDIIQEVAKSYYYLNDFEMAWHYYSKLIWIKNEYKLDIYSGENAKIGLVLSKLDLEEESENLFMEFLDYANNDNSIYKELSLAVYYSFTGDKELAINHLRLFSKEDNYHYWMMLFLNIDPLVDNIKEDPEYINILNDLETKFWSYHNRMRANLSEKGLIE